MNTKLLFFTAAIGCVASVAWNASPDSGLGDLPERHINIASMKAEHYSAIGMYVLPIFLGTDTIGPGTFVAIDNLVIKKSCRITVVAGTTILFEPGNRLFVEGALCAVAAKGRPIEFTNVPSSDRFIKVATSDSLWGGIESKTGSRLLLGNVTLRHARSGIAAFAKTDSISMDCINLSSVTGNRFLIDGMAATIDNPDCFSFSSTLSSAKSKPEVSRKRRYWNPGRIALLSGTGLACAGAITAALTLNSQGYDYHQKANVAGTTTEINSYLDKSDAAFDKRNIGWIVGGVMAAGVVLSITIPIGN
jgi:hypothetical protein